MIISHSHKFIFIHIPKTAGISIKRTLTKYCSFDINSSAGSKNISWLSNLLFRTISKDLRQNQDFKSLTHYSKLLIKLISLELKSGNSGLNTHNEIEKLLDNPIDFYHVFKSFCNKSYPKYYSIKEHVAASKVKEYLSNDVFKDYFKFAIVRNPIDWFKSYYNYFVLNPITRLNEFSGINDVNSFVDYLVDNKDNKQNHHDMSYKNPQYHYLYDSKGDLLVDYVGHFENLNDDWKEICKTIGIDNANLPHNNIFKQKNSDILNSIDEDRISQLHCLFDLDFLKFGYKN